MGIEFDKGRWARIKQDAKLWWEGKLDRPLIKISLSGYDAGRPEPALPGLGKTAFYDFNIPAEQIVDRWDYSLSCRRYYGDAFPAVWPDFGPGVLATFLGAIGQPKPEEQTVWFLPPKNQELSEIQFAYNGDHPWFGRIKDIMRAAVGRWNGQVLVGMTDLGGNLDILSSFRPSEQLLLDLYDHPEEVKRLTWQAHEIWWRYFDEFNRILQPANPGYSTWAGFYSSDPHYMLQCDFCYMISPEMFDEFAKPELAASCRRMTNGFYHLDGPGELAHLDSLLSIPELKGIQWIPGAGAASQRQWPEVFRKIRAAGKLIQTWGGTKELDYLVDTLGSAKGIIVIGEWPRSHEQELMEMLDRYGAK